MPTTAHVPLILIRGFGGLNVDDERQVAYQGFNEGTVYPQKRGENYIYEGLILKYLKSLWHYHDATNVVGYYRQPIVDERELPDELKLLDPGYFSGHCVVIDAGTALDLIATPEDPRRSLWVFRYYDLSDRSFTVYGEALVRLIDFIRDLTVLKTGRPAAAGEHHRPLDGRAGRARSAAEHAAGARPQGRGLHQQDRDARHAALRRLLPGGARLEVHRRRRGTRALQSRGAERSGQPLVGRQLRPALPAGPRADRRRHQLQVVFLARGHRLQPVVLDSAGVRLELQPQRRPGEAGRRRSCPARRAPSSTSAMAATTRWSPAANRSRSRRASSTATSTSASTCSTRRSSAASTSSARARCSSACR